jgi:hypothetical protein
MYKQHMTFRQGDRLQEIPDFLEETRTKWVKLESIITTQTKPANATEIVQELLPLTIWRYNSRGW